jgi:hypothetical protein
MQINIENPLCACVLRHAHFPSFCCVLLHVYEMIVKIGPLIPQTKSAT